MQDFAQEWTGLTLQRGKQFTGVSSDRKGSVIVAAVVIGGWRYRKHVGLYPLDRLSVIEARRKTAPCRLRFNNGRPLENGWSSSANVALTRATVSTTETAS